MSLIQKIKEKLFERFGFKSVIRTQIHIYKNLRKKFPNESEENILNILLSTRMKTSSILPQFPLKKQMAFYKEILEQTHKTIADVIYVIVMYEYVYSREEWIIGNASKKELSLFTQTVTYSISEELSKNRIPANFSTPPRFLIPLDHWLL